MKVRIIGRWGAYPAAGEASASYLLEAGDRQLLLDCGSGALSALQRFVPLSELSSVVISHHHHDHVADLGCLQYACLVETDLMKRQRPLRILLPREKEGDWPLKEMKGTYAEGISHTASLTEENGLRLRFFQTDHDGYCLGMRIEAEGRVLVYTADTRYNEALLPWLQDADLLIAESSFYNGQEAARYGHMTAAEAARLAAKAGAKRLVLTHLPHFGELSLLREEAAAEFGREIILPEPGMQLTV